ncbi:MAG: HAD family hydrolase [Sphaerochaetaceae bacterium]|jgi:Cof subfamily protein (haloacid dehalogenase superfamily)
MELHAPKKVVFLDVDGTIAPLDAPIPQSAVDAIRMARQNGAKVLLCTGRSRAELQPNVMAIGFDGMVGGAGAFVDIDGVNIFFAKLEDRQVVEIIDYFDSHAVHGFFQSPAVTYARRASMEAFVAMLGRNVKPGTDPVVIPGIVAKENLYECRDVTKVFFLSEVTSVDEVRDHFSGRFMVINNTIGLPGDRSGELSRLGITKATGMEAVLRFYGCERSDSIAIGDGYNDLEMIEYAGTGIAMGNAVEPLKRLADYVTADIHEDGLYKAFRHTGLID